MQIRVVREYMSGRASLDERMFPDHETAMCGIVDTDCLLIHIPWYDPEPVYVRVYAKGGAEFIEPLDA